MEVKDNASLSPQTQTVTTGGLDSGSQIDISSSSPQINGPRSRSQHRRRIDSKSVPLPASVTSNGANMKAQQAELYNTLPGSTTATAVSQSNQGQFYVLSPTGPIPIPCKNLHRGQSVAIPSAQIADPVFQYPSHSRDASQLCYMAAKSMMMSEGNMRRSDSISAAATGDMSAYQLHSPTSSLPQGVELAIAAEDVIRKRELRLMKNREAAKACRQRKKEYINLMEMRLSTLEAENKKLKAKLQCFQNVYVGQLEQVSRSPA